MLDWEFYIDGYGYLQSRPILNKAQFRYQPFSLTQLSVVYLILKVLCIYCSRPLKLIKFLCKIFNFWTRPSIVIQLNKLYMSLVATQKNYYFVFFVKFIVWFETWSLLSSIWPAYILLHIMLWFCIRIYKFSSKEKHSKRFTHCVTLDWWVKRG